MSNPNPVNPFPKNRKVRVGRKPGVPNNFTRELKEALLDAAEEVESLGLPLSQFLTLLGRVAAEASNGSRRNIHSNSRRCMIGWCHSS